MIFIKKSILIPLGVIVIVGILVLLLQSRDTKEQTSIPVPPQGQQDNEASQLPPATPSSAIEPQGGMPPSATPQLTPAPAAPRSGGAPTRKIAPINPKTITNLEVQLNALSDDAALIGETNSLLNDANKAHEK